MHVFVNDKNLDNFRFVEINSLPAVREHFTPKIYIDQSIDEPTLVLKISSLFNISYRTLNSEPTDDNHATTKSFVVDSLSENERSGRQFCLVLNDLNVDFNNNKLKNLYSFTPFTIPLLLEGAIENKYLEETIGGNTIFFQI